MKHFIDITKEHCPMTVVKVKLKLSDVEKGDELDILLNEGDPLNNLPRVAEELGFKILSVVPEGKPHYRVTVKNIEKLNGEL